MWIFSIFLFFFFWFLFYFISTVHVFVMEIPHLLFSLFLVKTLMRQKCVHESFTRNKGQVWVWARSSLRKLKSSWKLDHMELRLNFLVDKASWGPRGSLHKKVARSFSPSKIFLMQNLTIAIKGLFLLYLFRFRNTNRSENTRSFCVNRNRNSITVLVYKPGQSRFTLVYVGLP